MQKAMQKATIRIFRGVPLKQTTANIFGSRPPTQIVGGWNRGDSKVINESNGLLRSLSSYSAVPKPKRVAILGAGVSGITSTKSCLEEGLIPTTFEQHDDIGGTYNYTEDQRENQSACVYPGVILNTSKEVSRFSDFPMPAGFPRFLTAFQYKHYLDDYVRHFDIKRHILFNTRVLRAEPMVPGSVDGQWKVSYRDAKGGTHVDMFDAMVVCTGPSSTPKFPTIPSLESFTGQVTHVNSFRNVESLINQKVLVIGNQHSAGDMSVMCSDVAKKVVLSLDCCATFVVPRLRPDGAAVDSMTSRLEAWLSPKWLRNHQMSRLCNSIIDHSQYNLAVNARPYGKNSFIINDHLAFRIKAGLVKVKPKVVKFTQNTALFSDGTEEEFDCIMCATGYLPDFRTVDWRALHETTRKKMELYKWVFPLVSENPTIACIGNVQTFGAILPVFETQARWISLVFSGKNPLPSPDKRRKHWEMKQKYYDDEFGRKAKNFPGKLLDEMSEEFGAKPLFWKLLRQSPLVAFYYLIGPTLPAQYRLLGPGSNPEAWKDSITSYKSATSTAK